LKFLNALLVNLVSIKQGIGWFPLQDAPFPRGMR